MCILYCVHVRGKTKSHTWFFQIQTKICTFSAKTRLSSKMLICFYLILSFSRIVLYGIIVWKKMQWKYSYLLKLAVSCCRDRCVALAVVDYYGDPVWPGTQKEKIQTQYRLIKKKFNFHRFRVFISIERKILRRIAKILL